MKVEDLIVLTDRLSEIESQLQSNEQEAAQQQRRINTNLLTLHFNSTDVTAQSSEVMQSVRGLGQLLDRSTAVLISVSAMTSASMAHRDASRREGIPGAISIRSS